MQLSLSSMLGVFAPLLQQFILEGKAAEASGHDIKQVPLHACSMIAKQSLLYSFTKLL